MPALTLTLTSTLALTLTLTLTLARREQGPYAPRVAASASPPLCACEQARVARPHPLLLARLQLHRRGHRTPRRSSFARREGDLSSQREVWTGSEDPLIDVAHVATGKQALPPCPANGVSRGTSLTRPRRARKALAVPVKAPSNSIAFHPKRMLLAFAGDDKDKMGRDEGSLRILGFPS